MPFHFVFQNYIKIIPNRFQNDPRMILKKSVAILAHFDLPPNRLAVLPVLLIAGASQPSARVLLSIVHTVTSQRCLNMLVVLSLAAVLLSLLH